MKIRGIGKLFHGIRRISNVFRKRAIVLLYHRIAGLQPDSQLLCVSPAHFAEHMEHLRRNYRIISLQALREALVEGEIPHRAVAVTFDDGYGDNLWNARPVLERFNIPATVFVNSGYVGRNREFPSDELERCLLRLGSLPDSLTLTIGGKSFSWKLGGPMEIHSAWNVTMGTYPTPRHRCYHELHGLLRPLGDEARRNVLDDLAVSLSCPTKARPERRALNEAELKILNKDGLVEIGAHSVSHLVLSAQSPERQWNEINEGKRHLEGILGRPVISFAYPYGGSTDVSGETICLVQKAGFELACANIPGPVTARSDLFFLPRFLVRDWDGQKFARQLKRAFNG